MQGDELLHVISTSLGPASGRAPQTETVVIAFSTREICSAKPRRASSARMAGRHGRAVVGRDVDQGELELLDLGMAELEPGNVLQMIVQQPGMVEHRLQDQRLAPRDHGAVAAMHRARGKLRARDHIGRAAGERRLLRAARKAAPPLRPAIAPAAAAAAAPIAIAAP